ncbi:hypothetical protein S7335_2557 [Synechococcus sp. PCC 7335]|uniref:hypothetical protein n=1 Tax=Synechococcus sp. (strain ATCC 29403 / PCC 7335) TaxID=91464 RepID=UPI00017ECEEB|nr:hypothetical protein [Synechococcus sp. PCC 7335]EDX84859.1 hypothetical protein S7335_2557 [Synechococcus sp. PCC 7335]
MFVRKGIFGTLGMLALFAAAQSPAQAQANVEGLTVENLAVEDIAENILVIEETQFTEETQATEETQVTEDIQATEEIQITEETQSEAVALQSTLVETAPVETQAAALTSSTEEPLEAEEPLIAQFSRRRTSGAANSSFVGIGLDIGYVDDISFAVISKIAFADRIAVRPSVLIGDDVALLVPVTYDFRQYAPEAGGFQFIPYGGLGAAYSFDDDSELNLLLSAGVDVPVARQITVNAQANLGVFNDTDFGVTIGAAYNIGNLF